MDTEDYRLYEIGLGDRIRKILDDNNVNRSKFSSGFGITRATLNRYERGTRIPDAEFIFKFAKYFKVDPLWIIAGKSGGASLVAEPMDKEIYEICQYLRRDKAMRKNLLILARQKKK